MRHRFTTRSTAAVALATAIAMLLLVQLLIAWLAAESVPSEAVLLRAVLILLLGLALMPAPVSGAPPLQAPMLAWSLLCGVVFLAGLALAGFGPEALAALLPVTGGLLLLLLLFGSAGALLSALFRDRRIGMRISLLALLLLITLPLWAAPLVQTAPGHGLTDTIIALCPVSYLAVLADIDFLRGDWWYRHTPYGGMRYSYPEAATVTVLALAAIAALTLVGRQWSQGLWFPRLSSDRR